ncbi:MAG: hypothetical protein DRR08_14750 [Candidatus Parabeggiatoa sp. nov. 2]|nr:MAG: hypothetical protein B6247_12925 [Beggiatoa sp. 4572_84]RKZ59089.1 MAG: hypothetical protein DRR08_14750 [Gammaproteobacteria bacterium]
MKPENHSASENTYHLREEPQPGHTEPLEVDFYDIDPNVLSCFLRSLAVYLQNPTYRLIYDFGTNTNIKLPLNSGDSPLIPIDDERAISYMGMGCYLLGYLHSEARTRDKALFSKIAIRTCEVQGANILATFDYGKRYYLVLETETRPNGETNEMMFEGVIVNPQKYLVQDRSNFQSTSANSA